MKRHEAMGAYYAEQERYTRGWIRKMAKQTLIDKQVSAMNTNKDMKLRAYFKQQEKSQRGWIRKMATQELGFSSE